MSDPSQLIGVSMRGWICFLLASGLTAAILLRIPLDTQYITIINSVLVAYVVNSRPHSNGKDQPTVKTP
jgi:cytosine/uracil/thiamine/allantoin permease